VFVRPNPQQVRSNDAWPPSRVLFVESEQVRCRHHPRLGATTSKNKWAKNAALFSFQEGNSMSARYFVTVFNVNEETGKFKSRTVGFSESSTEALDAVEAAEFVDGDAHQWLVVERIEPGFGSINKDVTNFPDMWYHLDRNGHWVACCNPHFADGVECFSMHHNIKG
jgi:hypothetical protein